MKFLFDANMPPSLAEALRLLGKEVLHVGDIEGLGRGAPDQLIVNFAGENGYYVVSRDFKMAKEPWFFPDVKRLGAGVFFVADGTKKSGLSLWGLSKLIMKSLDEMVAHAQVHKPPFVAQVKPNGRVVKY